MKNILVINSGSTSIKYKIFDQKESLLKSGKFEEVLNHEKTIKEILSQVSDFDVSAVGHRFVHGGNEFRQPVAITKKTIPALKKINELAPLHNPYNLKCAELSLKFIPAIPQIAVFDTTFFSDLPEIAKTYPLPEEIQKKFGIRRFGFHGLSHQYALHEAAKILKKKKETINLIICHLGGGWSISAIKKGLPIDISMGYTPAEGLVMMSRVGDIDSGIIFELSKKMRIGKIKEVLNKESGIKALAGTENFKEVLDKINSGDPGAKLAFDIAIYRLIKYVGGYWAALGGKLDAIILTGAIGAGRPETLNEIKTKLKFLKTDFVQIESNEELMIAREVFKLI